MSPVKKSTGNFGTLQVGKVLSIGESNRPGNNYWKGHLENLARLTTVFWRLGSARYDCLPGVSISISDSFKLLSNMCLSLGPIKYDRKGP